jgi:hypothetical protein
VRLSPHPARAGPEGLITRGSTLRSTENGSSAGPLTAAMDAASRLSIGSGVNVIVVFGVHLTTSASFRAWAPRPVSGQLCATTSWRGWSCSRAFLSPFGRRPWLLGHPIPAGELGVPYSRLTGRGRTPTGFPCFARTSNDRGGCPLDSGDNGAHPDRSHSPTSVCRISATCPCAPPQHPIDPRLRITSHQRGFKQLAR